MGTANYGNTVKVHYTVKTEDGTVVDSTAEHGPFTFSIGMGQVIPGFETAVMGMEQGTSKTAKISVEDAYGPYHKELVKEVELDKFPPGFTFEAGKHYDLPNQDGTADVVTVLQVNEKTVVLDTNHPLAGKELTIDIELLEIM